MACGWQLPAAPAPSEDAASVVELKLAEIDLTPDRGEQYGLCRSKLPHRWDTSYPHEGGKAVYRIELPPRRYEQPYALYFLRIGNQAEIRVNGEVLMNLGDLKDPSSDYAKGPIWLPVPVASLRPSGSTPLQITVNAQANRWGGLSTVWFGPAAQLQPLYAWNYFLRQTASVVIVLSLALMGLMAGGLWWRQRDDLYGLLALTALFGVIRMGDRLLAHAPLPWPLWGAVTASAFIIHLMLMARFALQALGERGQWISRGFWGVVVGGTAGAFAGFYLRQPAIWTYALAATALPGVIVLACAVRQAALTRSRQSILLCVAGVVVILAGFRDFWVVRVLESGIDHFSVQPHAIFVFVLFMGWIVVDRYSHQVVQYRDLNDSLEKRIAEREAQLTASHEELVRQGEQQAILQERQRIMRDIHDGVGAHLVSLLSLVKRGDVKGDALQAEINVALDELRLAVDSLQPVHGDLTTVLATLRYRLQPRLQAAGLEVVWNVDALPVLDKLNPQMVLQIQRILLEAFTNVLRHARARRIEVSAHTVGDPPALVLEVADDGIGFAAGAQLSPGLGMQSMQSRSDAIGARLVVSSALGEGTRIRLELA